MRLRIFTRTFIAAFALCTLICGEMFAQQPWNGAFGNEWLQNKYSQKWLRIGISTKGIHKVTLPAGFMVGADPNVLHLYHRGVEVALTSASTTAIEFYGVPNDGSSDALLYRPTSARVNPYYSLFSDESAYFLTIGDANGKRAVVENIADEAGSTVLDFHMQTDNTLYQTDYTHATQLSIRPTNMNSFMEDGQTKTGPRLFDTADNPTFTNFPINLKKRFGTDFPSIKALVHGRSNYAPNGSNPRKVHVYIGPDAQNLTKRGEVSIEGFKYGEFAFDAEAGNLSDAGTGVLGFRIEAPLQETYYDRISVSYYNVTYKQQVDMQGLTSYLFTFPGAAQGSKSKIAVTTPPAGTLKFYDISDPKTPRVITGTAAKVLFTRPNDGEVKMLATTVVNNVAANKVTPVTFSQINKADFEYLIVSNATLLNASNAFAEYRKNSSPGKKYKAGVFKIVDLYNQFNYGEPSPLAIRRFVDYMTSDGDKEKYLLLMGKSVTRNDRMTREIPDEVPTFGFPGSDLLLVEGLQGTPADVPVIPFGRIPAINESQALTYLDKVKSYESTKSGLAWRKKVVHLSGGKTLAEIADHAANLTTAAAKVTAPSFGGSVYSSKRTDLSVEIEQMNTLSNEVNPGVGMITYFGHSSPYQTDYNFGYVSDPAKNFNNQGKYPIMFYNGCDILNVFSGNFAETVNTSTSRAQSLDWLLTPNKGAVAVFGNSWAGYATSCNNYMQKIYAELFSKNDATRPTLGKIIQAVAQQTKSASGYRVGFENARLAIEYIQDQAQVHQTVMLGDPALQVLLSKEGGLPVELVSFDAKKDGLNRVVIDWKTSSEVDNSHFVVERSYNAKNFEEIGRVEGKGDTNVESLYSLIDNKPLPGISYYRLKQVDESVTGTDGKVTDGKSTYSRIVSVEREGTTLLNIFPNPATDAVEIELAAPVALSSWSIVDIKGLVRASGKGVKVNLSNLASGEYILKVSTQNDDVYYKKIVKK